LKPKAKRRGINIVKTRPMVKKMTTKIYTASLKTKMKMKKLKSSKRIIEGPKSSQAKKSNHT